MVDQIGKALRRLSDKERRAIKGMLQRIKAGEVADLDIKKLRGTTSVYRVRKGTIRILYTVAHEGTIKILAVERRSDTTYSRY